MNYHITRSPEDVIGVVDQFVKDAEKFKKMLK